MMTGEELQSKPAWSSRTIAANVGFPIALQSAIELFPNIGPWVASHPQTLVLGMAAMNIVMRHLTAGGLTYFKEKPSENPKPSA